MRHRHVVVKIEHEGHFAAGACGQGLEQLQWLTCALGKTACEKSCQSVLTLMLNSTFFCGDACPLKESGWLAYGAQLGHTHMIRKHQSKSVHPVLPGFLENCFDWQDKF